MLENEKFWKHDLVRVADLKGTFSKADTTNWSYKLNKITLLVKDTKPSYKIHNLPERYNEFLLKKTEISLKEDDSVIKNSNITWIKSKWR